MIVQVHLSALTLLTAVAIHRTIAAVDSSSARVVDSSISIPELESVAAEVKLVRLSMEMLLKTLKVKQDCVVRMNPRRKKAPNDPLSLVKFKKCYTQWMMLKRRLVAIMKQWQQLQKRERFERCMQAFSN